MKDLWKDREFSPMLLKEVDKPFNSKEHIFEVKFDGIRAVIFVNRLNTVKKFYSIILYNFTLNKNFIITIHVQIIF